MYSLEHTVEAARGLDAPYHGIENLILMWDAHKGFQRPGTQNKRIRTTVHFFSPAAFPHIVCSSRYPLAAYMDRYCAGDETCF